MLDDNMLTQDEIDALLSGDFDLDDIEYSSVKTIDDMQEYLSKRKDRIQAYRGMFTRESHTLSFFEDSSEKASAILSEIKKKNASQKIEPIKIGDLELTNYSYCPECDKAFSFLELSNYYKSPFIPKGHKAVEIHRKEPRVQCDVCGAFFLPALVLENNGEVNSEYQYLCRIQTVDAIEAFISRPVLSRVPSNLVFRPQSKQLRAIKQDITLDELAGDSTLLMNYIQYTPYSLTLKMIAGDYSDLLVFGGFD